MGSWAAIAKLAEPVKPAQAVTGTDAKPRVAVIDANAIIHGAGLFDLVRTADRVITIPQVLREVRDTQSRTTLASLPFSIETQEPSEESVQAVVKFARATGDLHALSSTDTRLVALARTLEVAYYGAGHLREVPPPPKVQRKAPIDKKALPGWGAQGGDWAEIDRINEEEEAAAIEALKAGNTEQNISTEDFAGRIAARVQEIRLSGNDDDDDGDSDADLATSNDEGEDGGWEVAAKTKNKARRQRRRSYRRTEREKEATEAAESEDWETDDDDGDERMTSLTTEAGYVNHPCGESVVCCITGDFAMQNVLLQMGLKLSAPDGRVISSVSRWVLRCTACLQVTKEVGRLFCPRCGNATLDRVRVVVGSDGAEQYGVKMKHILRGTRFSLPKPKGGRSADPILREDQLLTKKHLLRARKAAERAASEQLDPFAPEYTADTWHQAAALNYTAGAGAQGATMALLPGFGKRNPNERKHRATNRRRK